MANEDIKSLIAKNRLHRYEVAREMGISDGYLSKLLRDPLTEEYQDKVVSSIKRILQKEKI